MLSSSFSTNTKEPIKNFSPGEINKFRQNSKENSRLGHFSPAREGLAGAKHVKLRDKQKLFTRLRLRKAPLRYQRNLHLWATFMMFRICWCWTFRFFSPRILSVLESSFCFFRAKKWELRNWDNRIQKQKALNSCLGCYAVKRRWKHESDSFIMMF